MAKIIILGAGGFGVSLAVTLHRYGNDVTLWSAFEKEIVDMRRDGEHKKLLPGVAVDASIELTTDITKANEADVAIIAVPSFAVRDVAHKLNDAIGKDTIVVNVGKGLEDNSLLRLSDVIKSEIPNNDVVVLSGPSHAEEIARGIPTTIVAACENRKSAEKIQDIMMNTNLRIYVNDDIIGVELGGALKNIIAVCSGVCDGLNLGDNSKAALMTRGIAEIARLGIALGAKEETFAGLSGIGDLIVTCTSMHSRNRRAGILIGQGLSADEAIQRVGMTVEGCLATKTAYELSKKHGVEMPIVDQLYNVLYQNKDIKVALSDLMGRPKRHENEQIWIKSKK